MRIVFPVAEQVRSGHVDAIADRGKHRHAETRLRGIGEDRFAQGTRLRHHRHRTNTGQRRGKARVEGEASFGVDDAHAVRADHTHAVALADICELLLAGYALAPDLAETRGDDDETFHAFLAALFSDLEHDLGRHHQNSEVHRTGDRLDGPVGGHRQNDLGLWIDGIDRTREATADQVGHDLATDRALAAAGADDGHRTGSEEAV